MSLQVVELYNVSRVVSLPACVMLFLRVVPEDGNFCLFFQLIRYVDLHLFVIRLLFYVEIRLLLLLSWILTCESTHLKRLTDVSFIRKLKR